MGWWAVQPPDGGIRWSTINVQRSGAANGKTKVVLLNKIPGRDPPDDYYNGDEPADLLDNFFDVVRSELDFSNDLAVNALKAQFVRGEISIDLIPENVRERLDNTKARVNRTYKREWGREAVPEELDALFNFCTIAHA